MLIRLSFLVLVLFTRTIFAQSDSSLSKTEIMTLGVFHFAYPNLDAIKTEEKDQISVLDEPFQSEITAIASAIKKFNPTIIAVELLPSYQSYIDSIFLLYKTDNFELGKNEVQQFGFRLGRELNLNRIYCVDDPGRHYEKLEAIFNDSVRLANFEHYFLNPPNGIRKANLVAKKISSIIDELIDGNNQNLLRKRLSTYLYHPFKYEEQEGDFTGVDFESGRWFNRNLRIFRNIQRISISSEDRVLLIVGNEHLNLLNYFFDVSEEFDLISPLPYLDEARKIFNSRE